jgi:hypothetical protein
VGGYAANTGIPSGGVLDEFRLYSRALSAAEITATWNETLPSVAAAPDIAVEQPAGSNLIDGASTVTFPNAVVGNGGQRSLTFTIRNTAVSTPLTGLLLGIDGAAAGDYSVSGLTSTTVNGGSTATFVVTFAPTATGPRTAALHILSNDPDESPFDIALTGTGFAPNALEAWRLANFGTVANTGVAADLADFDGDGVLNLEEWAFGTNPTALTGGYIRVTAGLLVTRGSPTVLSVPDGLGGISYFALYGRLKNPGSVGLTYVLEFSDATSAWIPSTVTPTVIAQDSDIEAVTVPFSPAVTSSPEGFFRVRVIIP